MALIDLHDVDTVWQLLERRAARTPDRPALLDERDRVLSFGGLRDRAESIAAGLHERGVRPGAVVSWQLPTTIDTVVVSLALARLGAVQNPIIPVYRRREVGALVRDLGSERLIVPGVWRDFDFVGMANEIRSMQEQPLDVLALDDGLPEGDPARLPAPPTDPHAVRWICSTSGTTSAPRGVRHSDGSLLAGARGIVRAYGVTAEDVGSIPFPIAHIGGPIYLFMMLAAGAPVVLLEAFVPAPALEVFRRHGVTMSGGSTAFYLAFLQSQDAAPPGRPVLPTLRILCGGGAPKPPEAYWQALETLGVRILHGYGMTECPMVASGTSADEDEQLAETEGAPVTDCEVAAFGAGGRRLASGEEGELRVRGPMVCQGYTDPEATAEGFDDEGWFRTGDLGVVRPDGHVRVTGRLKDVIIRKGENISAREIEDVLHRHPGVAAAAVIGLPDPERGERVCAVVEPAPGAAPPTLSEVRALCERAGLMRQKTPEQLEVVAVLPRNATMKILKHALRSQFSERRRLGETGERVSGDSKHDDAA